MVQSIIDVDRPERDQTRTELTLGRIGREWRYKRRGEEYTQALLDFLRSAATEDTLRSYSFSILQFFDWYQRENSRLVTPEEVRRADAVAFDRWLRGRTEDLTKWRLQHDPSRKIDLAIYEIVERNPGADLDVIREQLLRLGTFTAYHEGERYLTLDDPKRGRHDGLARRLACLVKVRTLGRTPSIEEFRRQFGGIAYPDDGMFRYYIPTVQTPQGAARASTIATRLSALASFWDYMIRSGENVAGSTEPLLRYNVWTDPLKVAQAQAPSHREATRVRKTPDLSFFLRLLATTFLRTHKQRAYEAAEASFWGQPLPPPVRAVEPSFKDLRDRALLLLMGQTGVRSREVYLLKRHDVIGNPPVMTVTGKRGKKRSIAVPPVVVAALVELDEKIRFIAEHQLRYGGNDRGERLLRPGSPLLPAVAYWGANRGQREQGLTRPGISQVLRRRAIVAGISPDGPDYAKAHPHGIRHMYAKLALESTPTHRVQAILGHASLATTGRYAEERDPAKLIAESLRFSPPVELPRVEGHPAAVRGAEARWEPASEPIRPPSPPVSRQPRPEPRPEPRVVRRMAPTEELEPEGAVPAPERPLRRSEVSPEVAKAVPAALATVALSAALVQRIERFRGSPLTKKEEAALEKCRGVTNEVMRNLCVIYLVHWGEKGNRQELIATGGGSASVQAKRVVQEVQELVDAGDREGAAAVAESYLQAHPGGRVASRLRTLLSETFTPNQEDEEDEEEEEEWVDIEEGEEEPTREDLRAAIERIAPEEEMAAYQRMGAEVLFQVAGTDRLARIYSGKDSGLSWWTGTNGLLKPEMPVLSPGQVGECSSTDRGDLCQGLSALWLELAPLQPTRAESLEKWVFESLDVAAQMEDVVLARAATWVDSLAPWEQTKFAGKRSSPAPRTVFREHLMDEVVAWFRAVSVSHRTSPGSPERWIKKKASPKLADAPIPEWYLSDNPVTDLPADERRELLDWIAALTGGLPTDTTLRFSVSADVRASSRADIAKLIESMCSFDRVVDRMREDPDVGARKTAMLMKKATIAEFPNKFRSAVSTAANDVRRAMQQATGGRVSDLDIKALVGHRLAAKKAKLDTVEAHQKRLYTWYLSLVKKYFGADAAKDSALRLVATCGRTPLRTFKDLFRVERGDIRHERPFKQAFAREYGVHSECVARRIARELWEIRQRSPRSEYVEKPQHMVNLVKVMQTFKVPCSDEQERDLRYMLPAYTEPSEIYRTWRRFKERGVPEEEVELEGPESLRAIEYSEITPEDRAKFIANVYGGAAFKKNPGAPAIPTPIHLIAAVMS